MTSELTSHPKELIIPRISEEYQVLAALVSTGAGFEALGGSTLMLTEPVENSVDSIIQGVKAKVVSTGIIRIFIDRTNEEVIVIDNGLGFTNPRHICERPFDSLKKYDPELTGKFARGLQGFRSYCEELRFVTRRLTVPKGESFGGNAGNTVELEFKADRIEVAAGIAADQEFEMWSWGDFHHGAVAFYRNWKKGEFAKIRREKLSKRIERHFGELIRKGQIEILIWEGEHLNPGKRFSKNEFYISAPRDYSQLNKINIEPRSYLENGVVKGQVIFELYLTNRAKSDRDALPFIMYKDRPVGDAPISLIGEFAETDVWNSAYLTGFVRADFCEINELRLAIKPGAARDFLYQALEEEEGLLREQIKRHHRGLIDIRRSQEINQLVNKLQDFLKKKKIFDFKIAKEIGQLTTGERADNLRVTSSSGDSDSLINPSGTGEVVTIGTPINVTQADDVISGQDSTVHLPQEDFGGTGERGARKLIGGPGQTGSEGTAGAMGYDEDSEKLKKTLPSEQEASPGNSASKPEGRARRRRPRGFNLSLWPDEFSEELSSFDPVNSTVIINSGHERYKKRDDPEQPVSKEILTYVSELYIWEICKLAAHSNPEFNVMDTFLKTKYEFFEA